MSDSGPNKTKIRVVSNSGRRSFLRAVGAGVALVAAAGTTQAADGDPKRDYADGQNSVNQGDKNRSGDKK